MDNPLSIAISALIKDNKILLLKREKGDYIGLLGLPGGKIEKNEHISNAAIREIKEETNLETEFKEHLGIVSEHLIEAGEIQQHFLLHLCKLEPKTNEINHSNEGKVDWYSLDKLEEIKNQIIPSDYLMIKKIVLEKEKNYFDCILEKNGENYTLRKFE